MSYRSTYTPWKSPLSSNYKTGTSSAYSSRDDVSSTSRYSSLATPSSYRPSFSGGTYRLKRDTPIVPASTYVSRYSAGSSASSISKPDTCSTSDSYGPKGQLKRYGSTSSNLGKYSREPSPVALEHTNRIKSRDPSPATRSLRGKSRDPSPALDTKCKIGYVSSANSYRMNVPKSTTSNTYGSRYGSSATARTPAPASSSASISYLSASDFKARSISKARDIATRKSNEKELETPEAEDKSQDQEWKHEATTTEALIASSATDEEEEDDEEEEKFVAVLICTRPTSPTPPGAAAATTVHRTRRIEIAKTVEKTIQRSTKKKKMLEKGIQSDRLDDSTRYSRFGLGSRVSSPYSPHTDRYTTSSLRYSHSPLSTTSKSSSINSTSESRKDDMTVSSTSGSNKSTKSPLTSKSKLSPPKSVKVNSRQSSVENLSTHKPPAAPKGESPSKTSSSSNSISTKLPNKDFRKSALNVGPTDRPRKSRTPSTGTDSDLNTVEALNGALQAIQRLERSPSAGSEVSNGSNRSIRRTGTDSKLRPRCHNKSLANGSIMSPKSPLSRNNSTSNIKPKSSTSSTNSTPSSAGSLTGSAATTTTSSSSGTESYTESKKSNKKIIKKKAIKDVTTTTTTTNTTSASTSTTTKSTADSPNIKSSSENSFSLQPPAVSVNKDKKSDSSTSRTTPKTPSDKDPLRRLKKLSSVSNFFAAQQQENTNSELQFYIESSENSSGNDLVRSLSKKSVSLTQTNETKTTPSPPVKTKNSSSSSKSALNYTTNSIDEPKNSITTKSTKTTSSSKSKTKSKTKSNTKNSSTSASYCPQDTTTVNESSIMPSELQTESLSPYTTTNQTTSFTSGTDQEDSSWWQDTSRQIDTASALDFNLKDDMRFKIRHIDSGETAWWLRNDEDDTLADDDLKTLNQEDELEEDGEDEAATDQLESLTSTHSGNAAKLNDKRDWWINETNDENQNENEENHETNFTKSKSSHELGYKENGYCVEEAPIEVKPFPKSRITPETDWWNEENEDEAEFTENKISSPASEQSSDKSNKNISQLSDKLPKQNGSIQLKICRVESGEEPWWLQDDNPETQPNESELTVEATIALPKKNKDKLESSSSNSDCRNRWMSGPNKKLFNIQRAESGEKAWWQEEANEPNSDNDNKGQTYKRNNSQEQEWWLEEDQQQNTPPPQQSYQQNGYYEAQLQQQNKFISSTEDEAELQQYNQSPYNNNNLVDSQAELSNSFNFEYSERPPPLGQCASPVQQEELLTTSPHQQQQHQDRPLCKSPYDNIPMTKAQTTSQQPILETSTNFMAGPIYQQNVYLNQSPIQQQQQQQLQTQYFPHQRQQQQQQQQQQLNYLQQPPTPYSSHSNNNELRSRNGQLFISRHQNIDELLGGSCRPISPLFYDNCSFQTMPPQQHNMFVEEITPDQVRIHDSTAQMPIIQRMERDDWQRDSLAAKQTTPPRFEQRMLANAAQREPATRTKILINIIKTPT